MRLKCGKRHGKVVNDKKMYALRVIDLFYTIGWNAGDGGRDNVTITVQYLL